MHFLSAVHFLLNFGRFKAEYSLYAEQTITPNYPVMDNCIFSIEKDLWLRARVRRLVCMCVWEKNSVIIMISEKFHLQVIYSA